MALISPRPTASDRYDIPAFIAELEPIAAAFAQEPQRVAAAVSARLPRLLATPDLLAAPLREPDPAHYRSHIVAVAPSGAFSVVALVWLPGQRTAIHDHIAWCVVGVLEGHEQETRYHLMRDAAGDTWLAPGAVETMDHGEVAQLVPPAENIHQVQNVGATLAISLHIYGADLRAIASHSSINQSFDHLPIRADQAGTPVPWRSILAPTT